MMLIENISDDDVDDDDEDDVVEVLDSDEAFRNDDNTILAFECDLHRWQY